MHEDENQELIANILNHVALALVTTALFCDIIKMNFGLDPAVAFNASDPNSFPQIKNEIL